jgi:hypothetical protein
MYKTKAYAAVSATSPPSVAWSTRTAPAPSARRALSSSVRFCGAHHITADVEVIPIQKVNEAYERLVKADVAYRFSIDMASL